MGRERLAGRTSVWKCNIESAHCFCLFFNFEKNRAFLLVVEDEFNVPIALSAFGDYYLYINTPYLSLGLAVMPKARIQIPSVGLTYDGRGVNVDESLCIAEVHYHIGNGGMSR